MTVKSWERFLNHNIDICLGDVPYDLRLRCPEMLQYIPQSLL